jgi:hypothetical protein
LPGPSPRSGLQPTTDPAIQSSSKSPTNLDFLYATCRENDGDLENELNPLKAPKGNYHIIEDEGVHVLNRDTFAHFVMPKDLVLVEFYAPWWVLVPP